jgi:hypothetical protein
VKECFWNEIKNNVYIVLQIQLGCTYGFAFICLDVFYPKRLIVSLTKVDLNQQPSCICAYCQKYQDELKSVSFFLNNLCIFKSFGDTIIISCVT